jgi:hypothetical protein
MTPRQGGSILKKQELFLLVLVVTLAALHALLWDQVKENPMLSVAMVGAAVLAVLGYWAWSSFKVVKADPNARKNISVKIESILHGIFLPRGYDIITLPDIDVERMVGRVELRDYNGIGVMVQYHEWPSDKSVDTAELEELDQLMVGREIPKGICLATTSFTSSARSFARQKNILLKDSDELVAMIHQVEEEAIAAATGGEYYCITCGSKLRESAEITNLMECLNPECGKTYRQEELTEEHQKEPGSINSFTINCYECSRPVELDTTMHGLVECPYDDCSWIINVDNELLALRGGMDKRFSENLAEISCPRCEKMIKVPANARGLMECPCEEKWVFDVGQALGERAEAHMASRLGDGDSTHAEDAQHGVMHDCPGCGAGVPAGLEACPVCGAELPATEPREHHEAEVTARASGEQTVRVAPAGQVIGGQITHHHAYLNLSTQGLLLLAAFSVSAFLAFVYLVVR